MEHLSFSLEKKENHLTGEEGLYKIKKSLESVSGIFLPEFLAVEENQEKLKTKKIILAGPPRSGKSCMREGLKSAIKMIPDAPYPYVVTACPDGEGAWFQESMNNNPALTLKLKAEYKSKFSPAFVKRVSESVEKLSLPLNFIDIGGFPSPENEEICVSGNGAILICGEEGALANKPAEWKEFFSKLGIPIIAEIYSDYVGAEDFVSGVGEDGVFRGSVHHLERGEKLSDRETIIKLANFIVEFPENTSKSE